ncbi:MAG TPA: AraC family transcriptional regulator [Clostridiaceae bacterium]
MITNSIYDEKLSTIKYRPMVYAYYSREWRSYKMSYHLHDRIELMYVTKGQCRVELEQHSFDMKKGDCIFLDAGVSHRLLVEEENSCRLMNIEFGFEESDEEIINTVNLLKNSEASNYILNIGAPYFIFRDEDEIQGILSQIIRELESGYIDKTYTVELLIYQLIIALGRKFKKDKEEAESNVSKYVRQAIQYIKNNLDRDLKVATIANKINIHPNYLHRIFKKQIGQTIIDYIENLRVEKAEMLLSYTDIMIIDMAMELGFGSRQYFSYVFKKCRGVSPAEYRKHNNKIKLFHES